MKRISFLLLFALHFFLCKSQSSYLPIFSDSDTTEWVILFIGIGEGSAHAVTVSEDTLINGDKFFRVRNKYRNSSDRIYDGYLKEDSLNKKVFFYDVGINDSLLLNTEKLLYDFDLSIGDTVTVRNIDPCHAIEATQSRLVLDSIKPSFSDYFASTPYDNLGGTYSGDSARVFFFTPLDKPVGAVYFRDAVMWAEGMGSLDGILSPATNYDFLVETSCIHKADTSYYLSNYWYAGTDVRCSLDAISIDQELESTYNIRIGQDMDRLILYFDPIPTEVLTVEIIDINGKPLYKGLIEMLGSETEVSLTAYPPGVYILRLYSGNSFYHKKFIK